MLLRMLFLIETPITPLPYRTIKVDKVRRCDFPLSDARDQVTSGATNASRADVRRIWAPVALKPRNAPGTECQCQLTFAVFKKDGALSGLTLS
jgi:hypothetical protein